MAWQQISLIIFGLVYIDLHGLSMDINDNPQTTMLLLVKLVFFMCHMYWSRMATNEKVANNGTQN